MKIGNILQYGIFDSKKQYPNLKKSPQRTVASFEFDYILSCEPHAAAFIDGERYPLRPNILIVRKPRQKSNSALHFKCYCLHLELYESSPFYDELSALPSHYPLIDGATYRSVLEKLFKHLSASPQNAEDYYSASKLLELFYRLKKDATISKKRKSPTLIRENERIKTAIGYMKKNFGQKITLETLGELTGYTPNHLQRIFNETMGQSPQKYLEKLRISHAKYLLSQNEKSIAEIAYECGFSSQSHFSAAFKRATEVTPYDFRLSSRVVF